MSATSLMIAWYSWLSQLSQGTVLALSGGAEAVNLPVLTAMVFGLIAATSPCQLTTNLGALAYASARPGGAGTFARAVAYVAGKVSVYAVVGALVIFAGLRLEAVSIPVILIARKALGPLMLIVGLSMLGVLRMRTGFGQGLARRLRERLRATGPVGAFLLGVAFSFAFCPTLFWLFFGLTVPLAIRSTGGWMLPGLFAVGSSLPLLTLAAAVALGLGAVDRLAGGMRRIERPVRIAAAIVLILAGLHDTALYWAL